MKYADDGHFQADKDAGFEIAMRSLAGDHDF